MKKTIMYGILTVISLFVFTHLGMAATLVYLSQEKQIQSQLSAMQAPSASSMKTPLGLGAQEDLKLLKQRTDKNNIPTDTASGNTRLRVSMRYGGYPSACGSFSWGEV